ncbi:MAG: 4-(cytidine 5'-diphospho)-2-C-methyl-D-erythritol kinase [Spirochaetota bacterium]
MRKKIKTTTKLNLFLDVLNKRRDNFHNIQSLFLEVDIGDDIYIEKLYDNNNNNNNNNNRSEITIDSNIESIKGSNNIIYKIWEKLKPHLLYKNSVNIYIDKKIPLGSGLGAGSSDGVYTLMALCDLFNLKPDRDRIYNIVSSVGSDLPFFIEGGLQRVEGKGEQLSLIYKRCDDNNFYNGFALLIVCPKIQISTPYAYSLLNMKYKAGENKGSKYKERIKHNEACIDNIIKGIIERNPALLSNNLFNIFENYIFSEYKELRYVKDTLKEFGAVVSLMSGSGASIFGVFFNSKLLEKAYNKFINLGYLCFKASPMITNM